MGTLAQLVHNTKNAMVARIGAVLVLRKYGTTEASDDIETAVQGPNGGLVVEGPGGTLPVSGTISVDTSALASQTTLAAVLAKIIAAPATSALQTAGNLLLGGTRTSTAPDITTAAQRLLEISRDGSLRVNADLYNYKHQTHLVASTAAQQVAYVRANGVPTYAFDGLWVGTEDVVVYGQPRGRAYHVPDGLTFAAAGSWTTAGTDWSIASNVATHAASGGGTDTLVPVAYGAPLEIGKTYVVYTKVVHRAGTSVTAYLGTTAGTAITATGEHVQALACAGTATASLVATDDWDGDVVAFQVYACTPKLASKAYMPFAVTEIVGVALSTTLTTLLATATCDVHGLYRRVPGAVDLA